MSYSSIVGTLTGATQLTVTELDVTELGVGVEVFGGEL